MTNRIYTLFFLVSLLLGSATSEAQLLGKSGGGTAALVFQAEPDTTTLIFRYSEPDSDYLTRFREMYGLSEVIATAKNDQERVQALTHWVFSRLTHNGRQDLQTRDAFAILQAAMLGQEVQCVEYGAVLVTALQAVGIPARPLFLKAADADTRHSAAGHALVEAWLTDQQRWAVTDSQWDIMPLLYAQPLTAVELQQAIARQDPGLTIATSSRQNARSYFRWVQPFLYYFDTLLDNRLGVKTRPTAVMLVPQGGRHLQEFMGEPIFDMRYTASEATFYAAPVTLVAGGVSNSSGN